MKLLLVEDDRAVAKSVKAGLKGSYSLDLAFDVAEAEELVSSHDYDLIILDLSLPDGNGVDLCVKLRQQKILTPILMLTAEASVKTKVDALDSGADDYLTKPFGLDELQARIRALLRRVSADSRDSSLEAGSLKMDLPARKVVVGDRELKLRDKEYRLLEYLLRNKGKVLTRNMIIEHVWESFSSPENNTVDVHIKLLRDKIDRPFGSKSIKTVHSVGYMFEA